MCWSLIRVPVGVPLGVQLPADGKGNSRGWLKALSSYSHEEDHEEASGFFLQIGSSLTIAAILVEKH